MDAQPKAKTYIEGVIGVVVLFASFAAEGWLLIKGTPPGLNEVVLGRILGSVDASAMLVLSYYFGSTRNSADQVQALMEIGRAAASTPIHINTVAGEVKDTTVQAESVLAGMQNQPTK